MKRLIALSLLVVFLSANTELHQLLKLPVLIHHYLEHHQDEHDKSFAHFLSDHYSPNPEHQVKDHHEHDNLPFKTNDGTTVHNVVVCHLHHNFHISQPNMVSEKLLVANNLVLYSSSALNNIWQPPKFS